MRTQWRGRYILALGIVIGLVPIARGRAQNAARACAAGLYPAQNQIVEDHVLHQRWAVFADCRHPERPLRMVRLRGNAAPPPIAQPRIARLQIAQPGVVQPRLAQPRIVLAAERAQGSGSRPALAAPPIDRAQTVLVRAGDRVHLWSAGANVRLELEGIALDYGRAGQVIHVRRWGNGTASTAMLMAVVDGAGSAELLP